MSLASRRIVGIVVAMLVALPGISLAAASPATAATRLGGVDVQLYCDNVLGRLNYAQFTAVWSKFNDPYSWRCQPVVLPKLYPSLSVDMNRACVLKYGKGAYAGLAARNVTGWFCQR